MRKYFMILKLLFERFMFDDSMLHRWFKPKRVTEIRRVTDVLELLTLLSLLVAAAFDVSVAEVILDTLKYVGTLTTQLYDEIKEL